MKEIDVNVDNSFTAYNCQSLHSVIQTGNED